MVWVRQTVLGDWPVLRDIRLEALRTAPSAFGSSYADEVNQDGTFWRGRSSRDRMFLAYLPEPTTPPPSAPPGSAPPPSAPPASAPPASAPPASVPAGLAGGYQLDPVTIELVSMYVRPQARGRGVGEALVAAVVSWARARQATSVHLWVTQTNAPARALYERCGFTLTGEQQPLPSDSALREVAMRRPLPSTP